MKGNFMARTFAVAGIALAGLVAGPAGSPARAATMTFVTPTGATLNNLPVDAEAIFTTSTDSLSITLINLQPDPKSVVQNLSDLTFTLSSGTVTSLTSSSGQEITVNSDGTYVLGSPASTGWALTGGGTATGTISLLGTQEAPEHTIIGPPGSGGTYTNANGGLTSGSHNPFLNQSATFTISGSGITADTTVSATVFSFNTSPGDTVIGQQAVPEPGSMALGLIGLGLVGTMRLCRRRGRA